MKDPELIPGEPIRWPLDAKPVDPQYTVTGTGKDSFTVPDSVNVLTANLARIAALEAEIARLNEAGRVLARECAEWRKQSSEQCRLYNNYRHDTNDNPTARAWVEEVANAKQQS